MQLTLAFCLRRNERQAMSIIVRVVIFLMSAYAGTLVADAQFADLPDAYQLAQK